MVTDSTDIRSLSIDELAGIVDLYPWFGAARFELCRKMAALGGTRWGERDFATNALYLGSRKAIADLLHSDRGGDYSDRDLEALLKSYTSGVEKPEPQQQAAPRRARAVGGDFFSQDEYDSVRRGDDNIFSSFAAKAKGEEVHVKSEQEVIDEFCTETLAQIYIDQGYYEQAKFIYSKLILRYPEKIAYFAALIEKLDQLTDN